MDWIKEGNKHNSRINSYIENIRSLFKESNREFVGIARLVPNDESRVFRFSNSIMANNAASREIESLIASITLLLGTASLSEQEAANSAINGMLNELPEPIRNYESFRGRSTVDSDTNIEDKVRQYMSHYLPQVELAIDSARRKQTPESTLVNQLDYMLSRPLPLLNRTEATIDLDTITVAAGATLLASQAALINPGQGNYRSVFRSCQRLAITELDTDWRIALQSRIRDIDVIVGYQTVAIKDLRTCPICAALDGSVFPKDFIWDRFHISCRCTLIPITKTGSEIEEDARRIEQGLQPLEAYRSKNYVSEPSPNVYRFINSNLEMLRRQFNNGHLYSWIEKNQQYLPLSLFLPD